LKNFQYKKTLDDSLHSGSALVTVSVLEELERRGGLDIAIGGRNEITLQPILKFLAKHLALPVYTPFLINVTHRILDIYGQIVGQSAIIDKLFARLKAELDKEIQLQQKLLELLGSLDLLMTSSTLQNEPAPRMPVISKQVGKIAEVTDGAEFDEAKWEEERKKRKQEKREKKLQSEKGQQKLIEKKKRKEQKKLKMKLDKLELSSAEAERSRRPHLALGQKMEED